MNLDKLTKKLEKKFMNEIEDLEDTQMILSNQIRIKKYKKKMIPVNKAAI